MAIDLRELLDARRWTREQAEGLILIADRILANVSTERIIPFTLGQTQWANMPNAVTPFNSEGVIARALQIDLRDFGEYRLTTNITNAGVVASRLAVGVATRAGFATTGNYTLLPTEINASIGGLADTGWAAIPSAQLIDGVVNIFGKGGNGAAAPIFGSIHLWLR